MPSSPPPPRRSRFDEDRPRERNRYPDDRRRSSRSRSPSGGYGKQKYAAPPRRSRSPDFAKDRARERAAYDARASQSAASSSRVREGSSGARNGTGGRDGGEDKEDKAKPNFERSGLLAAASNNVQGVALKYHEPPEARIPKKGWRLYVFKDGKEIDMLHIHRQSCYLIGRDRVVADIPIDHPSCSKQHAAIQYRQIVERNEFGDEKRSTRPFLIDLDSANGSLVNGEEVPASRYFELRTKDTITFGASTREYVLLNDDVA